MNAKKFFKLAAACLCIVCIVLFFLMRKEQPDISDNCPAPNIVLNGTTYVQAQFSYSIAFETCPDGFEYGGVIEGGIAEGCAYYINPQIPEWIYVEQYAKRKGTVDDFYPGYVRYVDESIIKDFVNYNGAIYVSMFSVEYPFDVDKALYDEIESTYGLRIEDSNVSGFLPVGTTVFEGFDVIPYNDFGSNTHQKEEQIYANADNENVILLSRLREAYYKGFGVYIKSNYNYVKHENAEVLVYDGRYFSTADLSDETVEWIKWYNSLSLEKQLAVDYEPYELRSGDD